MGSRRFLLSFLFVILTFPLLAQTGITSSRLGDNTGEDWEPAIVAADGPNVYALWPHFAATPYLDSAGATCLPFSAKVKSGTASSYMYFQASANSASRARLLR